MRSATTALNVGAIDTRPSQTENQTIEIISGHLRPKRSASQPATNEPSRRTSRVAVTDAAVEVMVTPNSCAIFGMTRKKIEKSKASSTQPNQAAASAAQASRVGR